MDKVHNSRENERVFHFLIPHAGNHHLPHALHHGSLFGMSAALIAVKAFALTLPLVIPVPSLAEHATEQITPAAIVYHANLARAKLGLQTLKTDKRLALAAQSKAEDMVKLGYFAHESPTGMDALALLTKAGYPARYAAENLAVHFTDASDVQTGWMTSPSHRSNIVDPRYEDVGVGVAPGRFEHRNTVFVVELFGKTRESAPAEEASLATGALLPKSDDANTALSSPLSAANLDRFSREFALYTAALLMALLMLTLVVRFRLQHAASMVHASAVIAFALVLMLA